MIAGVLPVSGLAVGAYLAALVAGLFIGPATQAPIRRLAWNAMLVLVGSIAGSAVWFTIVQKWILADFCPYCTTAHVLGLMFAALVIWRAKVEFRDSPIGTSPPDSANVPGATPAISRRIFVQLPAIGPVLIGLVLAGIMAGVQVGLAPTVVYHGGDSEAALPVIDYRAVPMIGSPEAHSVVLLLFDYQCTHCQQIRPMLDEAVRRSNGRLAFALLPTPLSNRCNPYVPQDIDEFKNSCKLTRISLAVWVAKREAFSAFDDWMFAYESGDRWRPRSLESATAKATGLVGKVKFDSARNDPWIETYLQTCIRTYGETIRNGNGGVPRLVFGSRWAIPEPNDADDLVIILEKSLGVPKP